MTDDIVTRLRKNQFEKLTGYPDGECWGWHSELTNNDLNLAANEIERLRTLLYDLLTAWEKEVERNNFPTILLTTLELVKKIDKELTGE